MGESVRNKSGLLPAAIKSKPKHHELAPGNGGMTVFAPDGKVIDIFTPPDPLIRVHEVLHTKHTIPDVYFGKDPFVQQIIEDIRLHADHWPWPIGQTPALIGDAGKVQLNDEIAKIELNLAEGAPPVTRDKRGQAFGIALRNNVALHAIDGIRRGMPSCFTSIERALAAQIMRAVGLGQYDFAAQLYEAAFFDDKEEDERESEESEESEDESESEKRKREKEEGAKERRAKAEKRKIEKVKGGGKGKPKPTKCEIDDKGPYIDPCGDPQEAWTLATSGSRIYRPALRRPVLPQRMFMRRRPSQPGGAIIIDASGSMSLTAEQIIQIIDATPMASVALYSGNDWDMAPEGIIYVVSKDGFRRDREELVRYIKDRKQGNSIDLEAINWLLAHDLPRTMVTDKNFCGSCFAHVARAKLDDCERSGDITVVLNGLTLIPGYEEARK